MAKAPASHMRYPSAYYWPRGYASRCQRNRGRRQFDVIYGMAFADLVLVRLTSVNLVQE